MSKIPDFKRIDTSEKAERCLERVEENQKKVKETLERDR